MLKEKLEKHIRKLQETIKKLKKRNYYLGRKGRILREFIENY